MYGTKGKLVLGIGGAAIVLIALLALHQPITNQLHAWKLLPEPERLTELYYSSPNQLPSTYAPSASQTVNFTVHNLEYRPTNYTYQIIEHSEDGTQSQVLTTGSLSLAQNQFAHPSVTVTTANLGPRVKLEVKLSSDESISYWLGREG